MKTSFSHWQRRYTNIVCYINIKKGEKVAHSLVPWLLTSPEDAIHYSLLSGAAAGVSGGGIPTICISIPYSSVFASD